MPTDLAIGCSCGSLKGVARGFAAARVNRVVCGCGDCQAYARYLGRADELLDAYGGTDIFQMCPRDLAFTHGADRIACLRLTPNGALRWYADCCKTPIANTFSTSHMPFMGMVHACIDRSHDKRSLDDMLGPVRVRVNNPAAPNESSTWALIPMLLRYGGMLLWWRLRGDHKRSPFFNARTGAPIVAPRIVGAEELRKLKGAQDRDQTN